MTNYKMESGLRLVQYVAESYWKYKNGVYNKNPANQKLYHLPTAEAQSPWRKLNQLRLDAPLGPSARPADNLSNECGSKPSRLKHNPADAQL